MTSKGEQGKDKERKKKDSIMSELSKFIDKRVRVKFQGGREGVLVHRLSQYKVFVRLAAEGVLKGYDALVNLVLDETVEFLRDPDDPYKITHDSRQLGLIVARGTTLTLVQPVDGTEQIANPFVQAE